MANNDNRKNSNRRSSSASRNNYGQRTSSERKSSSYLKLIENQSDAERSRRGTSRNQSPRGSRNKMKQRRIVALICVIVGVIFLAGLVGVLTKKNGREIIVAQESLGIVKSTKVTKEDLVKTVTAQLEVERGTKIQLEDVLEVVPVHVSKKDKNLVTTDFIIPKIREKIPYKVEAAVITADGSPVAILNNADEANQLLDTIMSEYIPEGSQIVKEESAFVQKVEVQKQFVDSSEIIPSEQAMEKLTAGTISTKAYTIVLGDSIYKIAGNAGMTVEGLLEVNPGMSITTKLIAGQQVNITVSTPFLSVKTVEKQVFTEKEPKKTQYQNDSSKPSSYRKVTQQGRDGQKEVTVQIIRINGFEEEQKVVDTKIIEEPITEIIVVGTK